MFELLKSLLRDLSHRDSSDSQGPSAASEGAPQPPSYNEDGLVSLHNLNSCKTPHLSALTREGSKPSAPITVGIGVSTWAFGRRIAHPDCPETLSNAA